MNNYVTNPVTQIPSPTWSGTVAGSSGSTGSTGPTAPAYADITPTTGPIVIDLSAATYQSVSLSGDASFTTSNRSQVQTVTLRIVNSSGQQRSLTFSASWKWLGTSYSPGAQVPDGKVGILSITSYGADETDIVAVYSVQP